MQVSEQLVVPTRFSGPPESGNGGWVSGSIAAFVPTTPERPAVSVRLRTPPPLEHPMTVTVDPAGTVEVRDGEVFVATAEPVPAPPLDDLPAAAPFAVALAAGARYAGLHDHPFPTCFACGTGRERPDALCLRPGPLTDDSGVHAAAWVPADVTPEIVWAALDCPGAWALGVGGRPIVLGTMTAEVLELPTSGEEHVVMSWGKGEEGRKHYCGTALYAGDGRLLAHADATWVVIDPTTIRPVPRSV